MLPMEVPLAVLADAANVSVEGKLNIFGIFNNISAGNFPALHPHMKLVVAFEADRAEAEKLKDVEIHLQDSDGKDLLMIRGQFTVPKGTPGKTIRINHAFPLSGIVFPKPDEYSFKILVNGETKETVPFTVSPLDPTQKGRA
jgi:hypothetical protein